MLRHRRLRTTAAMRALVQETRLDVRELIYPLFITEGEVKEPIASMPGQFRFPLCDLAEEAHRLASMGIVSVLLFGISTQKSESASAAYTEDGIVPRAIQLLRREVPHLLVITDVCVCAYTTHGHCGMVRNGHIDNDETLPLLQQMARVHAQAGADIVAPSAMMDGQVGAIRSALDSSGYTNTAIMAYSAKYHSAFYGPFREAAHSAPQFGSRKTYQMECGNAREALREIEADIQQGADIVMVKPALAYLDIIQRASERFDTPLAAYNVSGEYSLLKAGALQGWIDEKSAVLESLTAMKRAGARLIITYFAKDVAQWLQEEY